MLRRFLKARQWDVASAQQMWMDMLEFRALNNVDRILTDFHFTEREAFLDAYPHGLHKVDRKVGPGRDSVCSVWPEYEAFSDAYP
eukprot:1157460-Pelagomonas_calceolata.AAC.8